MIRTVYFYSLEIGLPNQVVFSTTGKSELEIKNEFFAAVIQDVESMIKSGSSYKLEKSPYFIEFYSGDRNRIFGIIGKSEDLYRKPLTRIPALKEIAELENKDGRDTVFLFDIFTYFLLDIKSGQVVLLRNSAAPRIEKLIPSYLLHVLEKRFPGLEPLYLNVVPIIDCDFNTKFGKISELKNMTLVFKKDSPLIKEILSLRAMFIDSQDSLEQVKLTLRFKDKPFPQKLKEKLLSKSFRDENLEEAKITGKSLDHSNKIEDVYDVMNQYLTKNVDLNLTEQSFIDQKFMDEIRKALEGLLNGSV